MRSSKIKRDSKILILVISAVGIGVFILLAVLHNKRALEQVRTVDDQSPLAVIGVAADDHIYSGDLKAPVQMIVYSDLDCPYCKHLYLQTLPALQKEFANTLLIAFRHLPLPKHTGAYGEAIAAECVFNDRGAAAFDTFVTDVYSSPRLEGPVDPVTLTRFAVNVGVNPASFDQCVKNQTPADRVRRDMVQGAIAGLDVTPSIVLKSAGRSIIIKGDYRSQIATSISYLLGKK